MKLLKNIMLSILILIATIVILGSSIYNYKISPVSKNSTEVEVVIKTGLSIKQIGKLLEEKKLVHDANFFYLYAKLFEVKGIKAGSYKLSPNMGVKKIIKVLEKGSSYNPDSVSLVFKEGINMRGVAKVIATNTNITEEEVLAKSQDMTYLDKLIKEYWFLTEVVKQKGIYYPLEGYLFPDTYQFSRESVKVEDIFAKMLHQMDIVLTPYKSLVETSNKSIHDYLTMASIVELEGVGNNTRSKIAGVFYNRLGKKMNLGSDVTTYYALKVDMADRDLTSAEFNTHNPYNTRVGLEGKLPIGPISLPSKESIKASFEPDKNNYLYFVADKNKNVFFTKTYAEHKMKVDEIKAKGDWIVW